ncbi:hypothetical protein BCT82_03645 [Vibrio breoganii]|uniref:glycosyltransferase n=1 Tax=Vibrio breoganii TaxID=553239 RepID=UPI000C866B1E|nr:glycosyltransferase [Vibrio breoganii]PML20708.1 hypothetical protein BCT82_03645 [Vibrio breoganii]
MTKPLVSVYICTYNRAALLKRAVESVLKQDYTHFEIVICSDNSSDSTDNVIEELKEKHNNIKYYKLDENSGACTARNKAIQNCVGEYITGLDDDDFFEVNRLSTFIENRGMLENYSFLTSSYRYKTRNRVKDILTDKDVFTMDNIIVGNRVGNQVFTLRNRITQVGGFDEALPAWQDYELWLRLIVNFGPAIRVPSSTYTIDVSHEHERISKSTHKIYKALQVIQQKYNWLEKSRILNENLELNAYSYPSSKFNMSLAINYVKNRGVKSTVLIHIKKFLRLTSIF